MGDNRITLTPAQVAKINEYFKGDTPGHGDYIPEPNKGERAPQIYFGKDGDETIELRFNRVYGGHTAAVLTPTHIEDLREVCYVDESGNKIEPACEGAPLVGRYRHNISEREVLIFMAAIRPQELTPKNRSLLTDSRVRKLREELGLAVEQSD